MSLGRSFPGRYRDFRVSWGPPKERNLSHLNTADPLTTQEWGAPTPPLTNRHKSSVSPLYPDSTSHGLCSTVVHVYWKSTLVVQVHVVWGSAAAAAAVYSYCKQHVMVSTYLGFQASSLLKHQTEIPSKNFQQKAPI